MTTARDAFSHVVCATWINSEHTTVFVVQWAKDYNDHPPVAVFRTEAEAEAWAAPLNDEHEHYWVTEVPLWRAADKE